MLRSFYQIVDDIKRKPYELLDYARNTFDRDYLEFNVNIHDLDSQMQVRWHSACVMSRRGALQSTAAASSLSCTKTPEKRVTAAVSVYTQFVSALQHARTRTRTHLHLQAFVDASFEHITSTDHALALLAQFSEVLQRDALQQQLEGKSMVSGTKAPRPGPGLPSLRSMLSTCLHPLQLF